MNTKVKIYGIVVFLMLIFLVDNIIGFLSYKYLPEVNYGFLGRINRSLADSSEILILGSSRAMHHYNSEIISKKLNKSSFNAGLGGYGIFLNYAILNERINSFKPEIVILDIAPNVIVDTKSYEKLNSLLPYYKNHKSFQEVIKLNPDFNYIYLTFKTIIFNSTLFDFIKNVFYKVDKNNNGFVPLSATFLNEKKFKGIYFDGANIDRNKINFYKKIIKRCKKNDIILFVVVSPCYVKYDKKNEIIGIFKSIAKNENISFFDFSNDPVFAGKNILFKDQLHLNRHGAKIFSQIVSERIKRTLSIK